MSSKTRGKLLGKKRFQNFRRFMKYVNKILRGLKNSRDRLKLKLLFKLEKNAR